MIDSFFAAAVIVAPLWWIGVSLSRLADAVEALNRKPR